MVSVYAIKPRFQALLRPLTRALAAAGVTANQVTIAAAVLAMLCGTLVYLYADHPRVMLLLPVVLFVRMALNAVDGMLAREHQQQSRLGAVLNELGDIVSDTALYLPLGATAAIDGAWMTAIVIGALLTEMSGVIAVQIGAARRYDGPMGKPDRALVLGALCLALGLGAPGGIWIDVILGAVVLLLGVTVVNRARRALRETPEDAA